MPTFPPLKRTLPSILNCELAPPNDSSCSCIQKEIVPAELRVLVRVIAELFVELSPALQAPLCWLLLKAVQPAAPTKGAIEPVSKPSVKLVDEAWTSKVAFGSALLIPTKRFTESALRTEFPVASWIVKALVVFIAFLNNALPATVKLAVGLEVPMPRRAA